MHHFLVLFRHRFFFLLLCFSAVALPGCSLLESSAGVPASKAQPLPVRGRGLPVLAPSLTSASPISSKPLYRQAQAACRRKHFSEAARLLQELSAQPNLPTAQIAFCRQQRILCLQDAVQLPVALSPVSTPPNAHSVFPHHHSAPDDHSALGDCGPRALLLAAEPLCQPTLPHTALSNLEKRAGTTVNGTSLAGLAQAAAKMGLKAKGVQVNKSALEELATPAIAWVDGNHYVAVLSVSGESVRIHDPNQPKEEDISLDELLRRSGGILLILSR